MKSTNLFCKLKRARIDLGMSIKDVSDRLKIQRAYLSAIENGNLSELPEPVYSIGFIRSYSKLLCIDCEDLVIHYKEMMGLINKITQKSKNNINKKLSKEFIINLLKSFKFKKSISSYLIFILFF